MKKYWILSLFILCIVSAFSQDKKQSKDKPPTKKEMEEMMKEMQKEMDGMSEEDKKLMDSMGFKMPDFKSVQKNMSGVSDADLKKAFEEDARLIPLKDVARINKVLSTKISHAQMPAFINNTHKVVAAQLSANTRSKATALLNELSREKVSVSNTAVGLWMDGKTTLALYLMGEACKADVNNGNDLNNYASFLTSCGAEELALPILENLNKSYPNNSTLLNNMAQAWLGLGDIARAEKYADSAIRIYAAHPQANLVKCLIEESRGNIPKAIAAAKKSITHSYSVAKQDKLRKLGYELKSDDLDWDQPMPQDALGLAKFAWPAYPLDVEQNARLEIEWREFKDRCQSRIDELQEKLAKAEAFAMEANTKRMQQMINAGYTGQYEQLMPGHALKAFIKLKPLVDDLDGNRSFVFAKQLEPITRALGRLEEHEAILAERQKELDKKYEDFIGEGKPNPLEEICQDENDIRTNFLRNMNGPLEQAYRSYLSYAARKTNDLVYYCQYTQWPEDFEVTKLRAQIAWLTQVKDQPVRFKAKSSWCPPLKEKLRTDSLSNFDDIACKYVSTMNLGIYKITSSCSNLKGEFNFGGVKINLDDNVETGRYSGSAIIGVSKGIGPKCLQAKGTVAGTVEWDNSGITDGGVIVGAAVKSGPVTLGGAEMRATVNTGISTSGKILGQKL